MCISGHLNYIYISIYKYQDYFPLKVLLRIFSPAKFKKKILFAAGNYNSNYALQIDGGRQTDRKTD